MTEPWQVRPEAASIANMVILIVYVKPQGSMEWVCPGGGVHCGGAGHVARAEQGMKVPASLGICYLQVKSHSVAMVTNANRRTKE